MVVLLPNTPDSGSFVIITSCEVNNYIVSSYRDVIVVTNIVKENQ